MINIYHGKCEPTNQRFLTTIVITLLLSGSSDKITSMMILCISLLLFTGIAENFCAVFQVK